MIGAATQRCAARIAGQATVPLPWFVTAARAPGFVPDEASGLVFSYVDARDGAARLGYVEPGGGGLACLSCAPGFPATPSYLPGDAFPDGKRLLLSAGENSSSQQLGYAVLECAPSLARCQRASVLPVTGFPDGPALQDRVPKLSPDGGHLVWTRIRSDGYFMVVAPLGRGATGYPLGEARVVNPPASGLTGELAGPAAGRRVASAWYEAKSVSQDGRELAFASTLGDSLNLDWFTMSLGTGEVTRLTRDGDWDEGGQLAPGGRFLTGGSSRGLEVTAALGAMPRPPLFDHAVIGAMTNAFIPRQLPPLPDRPRSSQLVQHVLDRSCEDRDAAMLAVSSEAEGWIGNGGGGRIWAQDGRRFVSGERRSDGSGQTRLQVVTLDAPPVEAVPPSPLQVPAFAPPLAEVALRPGLPRLRRFAGPRGGELWLSSSGDLWAGAFRADYRGYATADGLVLDGFTQATVLTPLAAHLEEQLTVSGARVGGSRIDVWFADAATQGAARSELDGVVHERSFGLALPGLPGPHRDGGIHASAADTPREQ